VPFGNRDTVPLLRREELQGRFSSYFNYPGTDAASDELVFLQQRSEEDWARLLDHCELLRFRAGDLIIRAGEQDRSLYIIVDGTLEILLLDARGVEQHYGTVEPKSVTGEMAFLDGRARAATIRALSDGDMLRLSFDAYETLAARFPELGRAILLDLGRILAVRLRQANEVIARRGG
jgi:CRP/FNR family transcriptional regulator, cyclic AMP receptor protein